MTTNKDYHAGLIAAAATIASENPTNAAVRFRPNQNLLQPQELKTTLVRLLL